MNKNLIKIFTICGISLLAISINASEFEVDFDRFLKIGDSTITQEEFELIDRVEQDASDNMDKLMEFFRRAQSSERKAKILDFVSRVKSDKSIFLEPLRTELTSLLQANESNNNNYRYFIGVGLEFLSENGDESDLSLINQFVDSEMTIVRRIAGQGIIRLESRIVGNRFPGKIEAVGGTDRDKLHVDPGVLLEHSEKDTNSPLGAIELGRVSNGKFIWIILSIVTLVVTAFIYLAKRLPKAK